MDGNLAPSRKLSPFATILARLLDDTGFYTRAQWTGFLRITPSALSQWVNDKTVPRADLLGMIIDLLRLRGGNAAEPVLRDFDEIARKPAVEISPLGQRMSPTVQQYMENSSFAGLGRELRKLEPDERQRVLATGSWEAPPSVSAAESMVPDAVPAAGTGQFWELRDVDVVESEIESGLLPQLDRVTSSGEVSRRSSWEDLLHLSHSLVVAGPGTGKTHLLTALAQRFKNRAGGHPIWVKPSQEAGERRAKLWELFREAPGQILVLIDGFDEISIDERREAAIQIKEGARRMPAAKFVVASRPVPELEILDGFESFSLAPLSDMQMVFTLMGTPGSPLDRKTTSVNELRRFFCHLSERRSLHRSLANPLFLKSAWGLFERSAVTPFYEAQIVRECVRNLLDSDYRKHVVRIREPWASPQCISALLGEISFRILTLGKHEFDHAEVLAWIGTKFPHVPVDQLLSLLSVQGLICVEDGQYRMAHIFLRDYFAALYVVESSSNASAYLKDWTHRADLREVLRLACGITVDATALLRGVLGASKVNDADRHVLLAEILAQPIAAEHEIVAESCEALVGWLDTKLEDWSIDTGSRSSYEIDTGARWQLSATGRSMGKAQQPVQDALSAIHRARSGPARQPLQVRMARAGSALLPAFAESMEVEGRLDVQFVPETKRGALRAAISEPQLV